MTTIETYRALIPAHADIPPATISAFITQASSEHNAAQFGAQFTSAMVYYAAHCVEMTPGLGSRLASEVGAVINATDGDVTRGYAQPSPGMGSDDRAAWLRSTTYGARYLAICATIAGNKPFAVTPR